MISNKILITLGFASLLHFSVTAQEKGFQKDKLFTGGSISLGFSSNSFNAGGSPVLGYSLTNWIDAGISLNYNYTSFNHVYLNNPNDKIRLTDYGGGVFTKIYPIRFIFIQGQFEHNFITQKFIPGNGGPATKQKADVNSLLLGAGYTTDRYPGSGQPFFYLSILFDVLNNKLSPYTNSSGNIVPIIRGGIQVPLFQGHSKRPEYYTPTSRG